MTEAAAIGELPIRYERRASRIICARLRSLSRHWAVGTDQPRIGFEEEKEPLTVAIRTHASQPLEIGSTANDVFIRDHAVNGRPTSRDLAGPIAGCVLWGYWAGRSKETQPDVGFSIGIA